ncbi:MAG: elongation factor P [Candidatus Paceibacterota bacterium]
MLSYNEILHRKYISLDGTPYEVVSSHIFRKQKQKPVNQTKLKNLITGKVIERSFHVRESVPEAHLESEPIIYLFTKKSAQKSEEEYWFRKKNDPKVRFQLNASVLGGALNYSKENEELTALSFDGEVIGIKIPIKVTLLVKEAPPSVKGNTAQGGTKPVVLETGLSVSAPLFIKEGDSIVVNTETGEYVERTS